MVIKLTNPAPLPEDDYNKRMKELFLLSLQELAKRLPLHADAPKTIVEIIAGILTRDHVTVSEGIQSMWCKRLERFIREQNVFPAPAVSPAETNPIGHLSPALQEKLLRRAEKQ